MGNALLLKVPCFRIFSAFRALSKGVVEAPGDQVPEVNCELGRRRQTDRRNATTSIEINGVAID